MKGYLYLVLAIFFEIIATTFLKKSEGFTKIYQSLITIVGYSCSSYFLSLTLKTLPIGTAYAIWSGAGIVLITLIGVFVFKQVPDLPAIIGMTLIVLGVITIQLFSKMNNH